MAFQNTDAEPNVEEAGPPPEESSNRPFLLAVAILGGIFLISLLCIAGYLIVLRPALSAREVSRRETAQAQNVATLSAATLTAEAQSFTATPTMTTRPTNTVAPTVTPVVVEASRTPLVPDEITTATFQALQTTVAANQTALTAAATSTGLPQGGWADEVGAPTMVIAAAVLIVVIFLARRLRTAGT